MLIVRVSLFLKILHWLAVQFMVGNMLSYEFYAKISNMRCAMTLRILLYCALIRHVDY